MNVRKTYDPKLKPKNHQVIGIQEIRARNVANFDDPGMGKAKQAYDTVALMIQDREIDIAIIAMSASLRGNFLKEVSADADQLIVKVVEGSKSERLKHYRYPGCHALIISYETMVSDQAELLKVFGHYRVFFALDEAHRIKNLESQMSQAALTLAPHATKTAIFTGTPIPNQPKDVFALFKFLGHDLGENIEEFRERFPTLELLREFVIANSIRRRKGSTKGVTLPPKTYEKVIVDLSALERQIYDDISENLFAEFQDLSGMRKEIRITAILAKLMRLIQFSSNPALLEADVPGSKMDASEKKVRELLLEPKEKVILWTSFRDNVFALKERLKEFNPVILIGGMTREDLMSAANRFQEDEKTRVLIAIPACAREGFTLTRARYAVYLDRNFSALDWLQSQDRIHRFSQERDVKIFLVEAANTLDQRIDSVLERKEALQAYMVGDDDEMRESAYISLDELREVLGRKR